MYNGRELREAGTTALVLAQLLACNGVAFVPMLDIPGHLVYQRVVAGLRWVEPEWVVGRPPPLGVEEPSGGYFVIVPMQYAPLPHRIVLYPTPLGVAL